MAEREQAEVAMRAARGVIDQIIRPDMKVSAAAIYAQAVEAERRLRKALAEWQAITPIIQEVAAERERQICDEGWSAEHDDGHDDGELARAAAAYAYCAALPEYQRRVVTGIYTIENNAMLRDLWPREWRGWWKPKDRRRDLVRAAALIIAEIERLDRAAARGEETS